MYIFHQLISSGAPDLNAIYPGTAVMRVTDATLSWAENETTAAARRDYSDTFLRRLVPNRMVLWEFFRVGAPTTFRQLQPPTPPRLLRRCCTERHGRR